MRRYSRLVVALSLLVLSFVLARPVLAETKTWDTDVDFNTGVKVMTEVVGQGPPAYVTEKDPTLVGWWKFDEAAGINALDSSGKGNNGTITGAAFADGVSGKALQFDGVDDFVRVATPKDLPLGNSPRTLTAWIKPASYDTGAGHYHGIVAYSSGSTGKGSLLSMKNNGWLSQAFWGNDMWQGSGPTVALNQWNLATFTYDGRYGKLYLNGALVATKDFNGTTVDATQGPIRIGCTDNPGRYFKGAIDEVKIYSRALGSNEVWEAYKRATLVAHYTFDEASGNVAYDSSLQANNGTMAGATRTNGVIGNAFAGESAVGDGSKSVSCPAKPRLNMDREVTMLGWFYPGKGWPNAMPNHKGLRVSKGDNYLFGIQPNLAACGWIGRWNNGTYRGIYVGGIQTGKWVHVGFTARYDSAATNSYLQLYIDGQLKQMATHPGGFTTDSAGLDMSLFSWGTTNTIHTSGRMDEVQIHSRVLSSNEVFQLYNSQKP